MITQLIALSRPLIALDCETHDKCPPEQARIIELGMIKVLPSGEMKRWRTLVNPGAPVSEGATKVHGITNEQLAEAPTFLDLAPRLAETLSDCDFCGYNVKFDLRTLDAEFQRYRVKWSYDGAYILDALRLWQLGAPRTLTDAVREFCNRAPNEAHRALGDAEDALEVAWRVLERYPNLPRDLYRLHDMSFGNPDYIDPDGKFQWRNGRAVIAFGKHNGTPLEQVDPGYLQWMTQSDFPRGTKKVAMDALMGVYPTPPQS